MIFSLDFSNKHNLFCKCSETNEIHQWEIEEVGDSKKYEGFFKGKVSLSCVHCGLSRIVNAEELLQETGIQKEPEYESLLLSKMGY